MEREELSRMLAAGHSLRATAQALSRAPSTLSRELCRHGTSPVTYRAMAAHQRAHLYPRDDAPRRRDSGYGWEAARPSDPALMLPVPAGLTRKRWLASL